MKKLKRPVRTRRQAERARGPRPRFGPGARIALALGLAALILAFAVIDPIAVGWQRTLPPAVVQPFGDITHLGLAGAILWPTGIATILCLMLSRLEILRAARATIAEIQMRLMLLFLAVAVPGLVATGLKRVVGRLRPPAFDLEGHLAFSPFSLKWIANGFPSGHATAAFATAVALGALWPQARAPLFALAGLIAASRSVLGSHYPSDAIGGAIIGALLAALVVRAFAARRRGLSVDAEGAVVPMPGPSARQLAALAGAIRDALRPGGPRQKKRAANRSARRGNRAGD